MSSIENFHGPTSQLPINQKALNREFAFDVNGFQPSYPEDGASGGEVVSITEVERIIPEGVPLHPGVKVFETRVKDPYVDADPEGNAIIREHIAHMEELVVGYGYNPLEERSNDHPYVKSGVFLSDSERRDGVTPFTKAWLHGDNLRSLEAWRRHVPTALALDYLTSPRAGSIIQPRDEGQPIEISSKETALHLTHVADAVGIRNRATAFAQLAVNSIVGTPGDSISWASLASGTAEPSLKAAKSIMAANKNVDLHVVDYDPRALKLTKANVDRLQYTGRFMTHLGNLMEPEDAIQRVVSKVDKANRINPDKDTHFTDISDGFTVVENTGFEEYLPEEGDEIEAFKGSEGLISASDFTKAAWDAVAPGGILLSGNMVLDRPEINFVFGIVGWPLINARSEQSILRVYEKAGVLADPRAEVSIHRVIDESTNDHVYDLVKVKKSDGLPAAKRIGNLALVKL